MLVPDMSGAHLWLKLVAIEKRCSMYSVQTVPQVFQVHSYRTYITQSRKYKSELIKV